jgi:hypothetical protein
MSGNSILHAYYHATRNTLALTRLLERTFRRTAA